MADGGSHFAADWLALREPVDHRSRADELAQQLARHLSQRGGSGVSVVDLGAGRGSNLRYLAPRLGAAARWTLLDQDAALLAAVGAEAGLNGMDGLDGVEGPNGVDRRDSADGVDDPLKTRVFDLAAPLAPVLAGADLVTASALLDLVSADWAQSLSEACADAGAAVLAALTVDGRVEFSAPDPFDEMALSWVADDQHRDKGLGVALGAQAGRVFAQALRACGYQVTVARSDWNLSAADGGLVRALIEGWRDAACRRCPQVSAALAAWARRRTHAVLQGYTRLTVGHVDVLGLPPGSLRGLRKSKS